MKNRFEGRSHQQLHDDYHVYMSLCSFITFIVTGLAIAAFVLALINSSRTNNVSSRLSMVETIVTMPPPPDTTATVYINTDTGNDVNDGKTPSTAVATLPRALAVLQQSVGGALATVQLAGVAPLNLGTDPIVQLGPLVMRFSRIRIRGTPGIPIQDTVLSISTGTNNWQQVTGTTGGYVANAYQRHFVRNERNGRTFVVEQNGAATLDTIVGPVVFDISQPQPPMSVVSPETPWIIGDTFTVFQATSVIQWNGGLVLDIPYGTLLFEALSFEPGVIDSYLSAPDGPQHRVEFEGSHITLTDTTVLLAFIRGSVFMRGVHAAGAVGDNTRLFGKRTGSCIQTESLWLENGVVAYSGTCASLWFRYDTTTGSSPTWALFITEGAQFYGFSIQITEPVFAAVGVTSGSSAFFLELRAIRTSVFDPGFGFIGIFHASNVVLQNIYTDCTGCLVALDVVSSSDVNVQGSFTSLSSASIVRVQPSAQLSFTPILFVANPTFAQPPLVVESGATLSITPPNIGMTLSTVGNAAEIVTVRGQLTLEGDAATYLWSTDTNTPLISVVSGGSVTRTIASHIVNDGPTSTHVAKCGANVIYNYQTSQNDFAAVGTQNCKCSR